MKLWINLTRPSNLHLGRTYVYFGDPIFWGGQSYDWEGCHGHMGKKAPAFSLQTGNFPLRTLIGIITILPTEGRLGFEKYDQ
jgi:hypothetical protein